jgi:hypothetical protein
LCNIDYTNSMRQVLFLFIFYIIISFYCSAQIPNLQAHYLMNGNAGDSTGHGYNGTINGSPTLTSDRNGNSNSAYSFDGVDDYIDLPNSTIGNWSVITYSAWVYASPYSGVGWPGFIGATTNGVANNINIGIWQGTGHMHLEVQTSNGNFPMEGNLSIPWNTWFHVVLVYDGISLTEYLNGIKGKSIPASGTLLTVTDLTLGQASSGFHFFNGRLDDVRIYHQALTPDEVLVLYRECDGLWAYYPLNGNVGDSTGHGYNGTINGNPTLTSDRFGTPNSAYSFDGVDDYIDLPNSTIGNWSVITYSAWVYASPYSGVGWPGFIGATTNGVANNINLGIWQGTDHLHLEVQTSNGNFPMEGNLSIPWNTWFHVVFVYDGTSLTEYLNGVKGRSIPASGTLLTVTDITLGQASSGFHFFNGKLDDVKIFNCALSAIDVLVLYTEPLKACCEIFTPNLITPNGDGKNETLFVTNDPLDIHIEIYNSWGEKIFKSDNYQNEWGCTQVNEGIYYYYVNGCCEKSYKGWLQIIK